MTENSKKIITVKTPVIIQEGSYINLQEKASLSKFKNLWQGTHHSLSLNKNPLRLNHSGHVSYSGSFSTNSKIPLKHRLKKSVIISKKEIKFDLKKSLDLNTNHQLTPKKLSSRLTFVNKLIKQKRLNRRNQSNDSLLIEKIPTPNQLYCKEFSQIKHSPSHYLKKRRVLSVCQKRV